MKLSASLYSSKYSSLIESANELEGYMVDYWHIDSRENFSVFEDIDKLGAASAIPVDLHLITRDPFSFYKELNRENIRRVSFQIEEIQEDFQFQKLDGKDIGLAIQIGHPTIIKTISQYKDQVDFVLIMMTTPGISGGQFNKDHFAIIRHLVQSFPEIQWCIDGGVNHEVSYILRLIGVQSVVIGSYLLNHENMAQAILQIRSTHVRSEFKVKDFYIPNENLPIVTQADTVISLLLAMQKYQLGIAFFLDAGGRLSGIISNADIRKVLIEGDFTYDTSIKNFINANPKFISDDASTSDMIEYIRKISFPILVLPVLNHEKKLKGAISFHKLLKEE